MLADLSLMALLLVAAICLGAGHFIGCLRTRKQARQHRSETDDLTLELQSLKVTCTELEVALENAELLHRSKNQFYSSTSHDLRQPLHALSMFSSVLKKQDLNELSRELATDISDAVYDVTREIDLLLNIARTDVDTLKLRPVEVHLGDETRRIVNQFQRKAVLKGLELKVLPGADHFVYLDRSLFDRVLRNLIDNAIKFTDSGYVHVSISYTGEVVHLSVVDSGIGISNQDRENIYREYYQGRDLSGEYLAGVGLGLTTVLTMISRLSGDISVETTREGGTSFKLEFPATEYVDETKLLVQGNPATLTNVKPRSVLVLESDELVGKSTIMLLQSAGFEVCPATSLSQAHSIQQKRVINAACLGLTASDDSAAKLIEVLRASNSEMPVVVMTSDKATAERYSHLGIDVLVKPFASDILLKRLDQPA